MCIRDRDDIYLILPQQYVPIFYTACLEPFMLHALHTKYDDEPVSYTHLDVYKRQVKRASTNVDFPEPPSPVNNEVSPFKFSVQTFSSNVPQL